MRTLLYTFHINFSFRPVEIIGAVLIFCALFTAYLLPGILNKRAPEEKTAKNTLICKLAGMAGVICGVVCIVVL